MEMGVYRPPGVLFTERAIRRHTVSEHRGTKPPADEQLPGQPSLKILKAHGERPWQTETMGNKLSDDDHKGLGKLRVKLFNLADQFYC